MQGRPLKKDIRQDIVDAIKNGGQTINKILTNSINP